MIAYISGPITGNPGYRQDFWEADRWLHEHGWETINPVHLCSILPVSVQEDLELGRLGGSRYLYYVLRVEFRLIDMADAVVLLPGWENSHGACQERNRAINKGKQLYALIDGELKEVKP